MIFDKKNASSQKLSSSSKEKPEDLKTLLQSKPTSNDWSILLIKRFCEEEVLTKISNL